MRLWLWLVALSAACQTAEPPPKLLITELPLRNLKPADIRDTFQEGRGDRGSHEAIDILAPKGTPVHAVADGTIEKLFFSKNGGITVYHFDIAREHAFYYAHLDRYAEGLKEKQAVKAGDLLGYVGVTGNAPPDTPHLHFTIFQLGPEKQWWKGTAINPYPLLLALAQKGRGGPTWVLLWHNRSRAWYSTLTPMARL
ncbi:MAG: M23 family metallopeptidase [Bryobacterales bacterium]|nr:M23 family metallopeptidase [Bryobacterales bacterium]